MDIMENKIDVVTDIKNYKGDMLKSSYYRGI